MKITDSRGTVAQDVFPLSRVVKVGYNSYLPGWSTLRIGKTSTLYYVISGKISFTLNGNEYVLDAGNVFYLALDEVATIKNASESEKCSLYYITFRFKDGLDFHNYEIDRPIVDKEKRFFAHFKRIYKTRLAEGEAYQIKEFSEFCALAYDLFTHKLNNDLERRIDMKLEKAVQYIRMNYYKPISMEALARVSGYSVSHLRRLFIACYGMPPQKYLIDMRISKAKELLMDDDDKTVEEVAAIIGMCDTSHFCKIFKKRTGVTPLCYKKGVRTRLYSL